MNKIIWTNPHVDRAMVETCNVEFERILTKINYHRLSLDQSDLLDLYEFEDIEIDLSSRLKVSAGKAKFRINNRTKEVTRKVTLNVRLLRDNPEHILTTFVHELCHVFVFDNHGRHADAHGVQWQRMMMACGYSPERCHDLDVSKYRTNRHPVECGCENNSVGATVAKRMSLGMSYSCGTCHQSIKLKTQPKKTLSLLDVLRR